MREKPHVKPESFQKANPSDWLFELKIIELFESSQSPTTTKNGGITKAFRAYQYQHIRFLSPKTNGAYAFSMRNQYAFFD